MWLRRSSSSGLRATKSRPDASSLRARPGDVSRSRAASRAILPAAEPAESRAARARERGNRWSGVEQPFQGRIGPDVSARSAALSARARQLTPQAREGEARSRCSRGRPRRLAQLAEIGTGSRVGDRLADRCGAGGRAPPRRRRGRHPGPADALRRPLPRALRATSRGAAGGSPGPAQRPRTRRRRQVKFAADGRRPRGGGAERGRRRRTVEAKVPGRGGDRGPCGSTPTGPRPRRRADQPLKIVDAGPDPRPAASSSSPPPRRPRITPIYDGAARAAASPTCSRAATATDVRVEVVNRETKEVVDDLRPGRRRARTPTTSPPGTGGRPTAAPAADGDYRFELGSAGGGRTVATTSDSQFGYHRYRFPLDARHTYGDGFGAGRGHEGQDVFAKCGTPIHAVRGGRVQANDVPVRRRATTSSSTARAPARLRSTRTWSRRSPLREGARVRTGQLIGDVGPDRQRVRLPPALRDLVGPRLVRGRPPDADGRPSCCKPGTPGAEPSAERGPAAARSSRLLARLRRAPRPPDRPRSPPGPGSSCAGREVKPPTAYFDGAPRGERPLRVQRADRRLDLVVRVVHAGSGRGGAPLGRATASRRVSRHRVALGRPSRRPPRRRATAPTRSGSARRATRRRRSGGSSSTTTSSPLPVAHTYGDRFGDPRSGGRVHEGQDLPAGCGTPLIAARGGRVAGRPATATRSTATTC